MRPLRDLLSDSLNSASRAAPPSSSSTEGEAVDLCALCGASPSYCGGQGFVRLEVPVDDERFGKPIRCPNYRADGDSGRIEKMRALSNLDTFAHCTFASFQTEIPGLPNAARRSLQIAASIAHNYAMNPSGWLVMFGGMGCGKTHLAAAIGHERIQRGDTVLFVTAPDLLDHLRSTYGPSSEIGYDDLFERLRTAPLLIIDDLGAENVSPWAREKMYQLINSRYSTRLPTIITTNVDDDMLDPRLRSRIMDTQLARQILIDAPDYRNASQGLRDPISDLTIYADMRFENFDTRTNASPEEERNLNAALDAAMQYAARPQRWLVWTSTYFGSGKTHLAAAIGHAVSDAGGKVVFLTAPDLLDKIRRSYGAASIPGATTSDALYNTVRDTDLLVLDDLGIQNETNWAREKLFQILNHRYVTGRPTVITTGVKKLGDLDPRIVARLVDQRRCTIRQITARDFASRMFKGNRS